MILDKGTKPEGKAWRTFWKLVPRLDDKSLEKSRLVNICEWASQPAHWRCWDLDIDYDDAAAADNDDNHHRNHHHDFLEKSSVADIREWASQPEHWRRWDAEPALETQLGDLWAAGDDGDADVDVNVAVDDDDDVDEDAETLNLLWKHNLEIYGLQVMMVKIKMLRLKKKFKTYLGYLRPGGDERCWPK